jgi:hypothetical protein
MMKSALASLTQHHCRSRQAIRQDKVGRGILIGKEEVKLPLFVDDVLLHIEIF